MAAPTVAAGLAEFYARRLTGAARAWATVACAETARTYAALKNPVTPGRLSYLLALGFGIAPSTASRAGTLLDALQPIIDLADNIADEPLDRARGITLEARYPEVPRDALFSLPALMMACVTASLYEDFAAPAHRPREAATRVLDVLSRMTEGQGQALAHPERVDNISSRQATLLCLPLWLHAPLALDDPRLASAERWAFAYGRLWQLHQDVTDAPGEAAPRERFERALVEARDAWPDFEPFTRGASLSRERLLPRGAR